MKPQSSKLNRIAAALLHHQPIFPLAGVRIHVRDWGHRGWVYVYKGLIMLFSVAGDGDGTDNDGDDDADVHDDNRGS